LNTHPELAALFGKTFVQHADMVWWHHRVAAFASKLYKHNRSSAYARG